MCAGVQKVSRPMLSCHEMSQTPPKAPENMATTQHHTYQGILPPPVRKPAPPEAVGSGMETVCAIAAALRIEDTSGWRRAAGLWHNPLHARRCRKEGAQVRRHCHTAQKAPQGTGHYHGVLHGLRGIARVRPLLPGSGLHVLGPGPGSSAFRTYRG